jgi:hypothetical protein
MELENNTRDAEGLDLLKQPVLPLVNMVEFLYLTGPFKKIKEVLSRMTKPVELEGVQFENPQQMLRPYETVLQEFEVIKGEKKLSASLPFIVDEKQNPLAKRGALELWIKQQVLSQELEKINSSLCGPCGCVLCCTGPNSEFDTLSGFKGEMRQEFFEIPLGDSEVDIFTLSRIDTEDSRKLTAQSEPSLQLDQIPFYKHETALYHWQNGWSLILPQGSICPRLSRDTPYVLEKTADTAKRNDGVLIPVYMAWNKVLAVWDCPYVRKYQDEIGGYAEMSGLVPIFKKSKT